MSDKPLALPSASIEQLSKSRIAVFYDSAMVVQVDSFSPSAGKPALVVTDWEAQGFDFQLCPVPPIAPAQLCLAHAPDYVRAILEGRLDNGFGNKDIATAHSTLYTVGAMLGAAKTALRMRWVAVAPVSGFHHAYHATCHGFCTFNGLMVTAMALKQEGFVNRVGILDLDQHWGDGTDDILQVLKIDWVEHYSAGKQHRESKDARAFLHQLPNLMQMFTDCDVLLYQAGADAHEDDPLGGWMTTSELRERDRIVFETTNRLGLPIAWNLAGGYQRDKHGTIGPVLEIHRNTMRECQKIYL